MHVLFCFNIKISLSTECIYKTEFLCGFCSWFKALVFHFFEKAQTLFLFRPLVRKPHRPGGLPPQHCIRHRNCALKSLRTSESMCEWLWGCLGAAVLCRNNAGVAVRVPWHIANEWSFLHVFLLHFMQRFWQWLPDKVTGLHNKTAITWSGILNSISKFEMQRFPVLA